jgi:hypothetical protein
MNGCATIVVLSFTTYGLVVWPFFVMPEYTIFGLLTIIVLGMAPATVFGALAVRRAGLAGAAGFFGGAMASAVFIFLRLQQTQLGRLSYELPDPEYPAAWGWMLPLAWFLFSGGIAAVLLPKEKDSGR